MAVVITVILSVPLLNSKIESLNTLSGGLISDVQMQISSLNATLAESHVKNTNLSSRISLLQNQFNTSQHELENLNSDLQKQIDDIKDGVRYNCGPGLWRRVAYLNMSDPSYQCPPVWREYSANGVRACGRPANAPDLSFYSMKYSSNGSYAKVCGRVIGYQIGDTDVFDVGQHNPIDSGYVDGVSITYGSMPRKHIWTYAAGLSDVLCRNVEIYSCPCLLVGTSFASRSQVPPSYVGSNYYCESGFLEGDCSSADLSNVTLNFVDDPLWDGQNCEGQCCSDGRNPPWFSVQLTDRTASDVEVCICGTEESSNDDVAIKLLELFVQ